MEDQGSQQCTQPVAGFSPTQPIVLDEDDPNWIDFHDVTGTPDESESSSEYRQLPGSPNYENPGNEKETQDVGERRSTSLVRPSPTHVPIAPIDLPMVNVTQKRIYLCPGLWTVSE